MIGLVLDNRYKLTDFIGQGGMALVYKALDQRTHHAVAIKILKPEYKNDEEFLRRFEREAQAASKVSHHNIVNLLDVGSQDNYRYLVLEYVEGRTLKEIIDEKGALPPKTAVQIAIRLLSALQHMHKNGIIHRDIKPQNIIVDADYNVKVTDFGIARRIGKDAAAMVDVGTISVSNSKLTLTGATAGATFTYTTDGSNPKTSETADTLTSGTTAAPASGTKIKVYGYKTGLLNSGIVEYTVA